MIVFVCILQKLIAYVEERMVKNLDLRCSSSINGYMLSSQRDIMGTHSCTVFTSDTKSPVNKLCLAKDILDCCQHWHSCPVIIMPRHSTSSAAPCCPRSTTPPQQEVQYYLWPELCQPLWRLCGGHQLSFLTGSYILGEPFLRAW